MKRKSYILILCSLMAAACGFSMPVATDLQSHGLTQTQLDSLAGIMQQAVEQNQIAGGSFIVAHKGEIVFREAFGYADIEAKRPFTTDELLPIASVSKPFMASVIMALVEQGKLNLDDPVEKYLPEFKGKRVEGSQSPARPMTIRQLISHTAGFWGNKKTTPEKLDLVRNFERTLAEAVDLISAYDLAYEPGKNWIYSGAGYCVLGRVAEVALGQSLEEIAQDALFRPMGLKNTTFLPSKETLNTVPTGYLRKGEELQRQRSMADIENFRFILPGGSLFTNLDELAKLGQMHLNDGVYNGKRILSEASVTEMRRLQSPDRPARTYGLGWFRDDISECGLAELIFHGGLLGAHFRVDRNRDMVCAFLVHQNSVQVQKLKEQLVEKVNELFPEPNPVQGENAKLLLGASTLGSQSLQAVNLRVEHLDQPIGIGESAPRLSWQLQALDHDQRGLAQSAYRVLVASTEDKLANNRGDLWDSGKVLSDNSRLVRFGGSPLGSRTRAYWKVMSWDQDGKAGKWSVNSSWSTGLLERSEWKAEWIAMEDNHEFETSENVTFLADDPTRNTLRMRPAKYFRKDFDTGKSVRSATLYATARGVFEVEINGQRVGDEYLAPGWTDYNKRLYYKTYDVTGQIQANGNNAIGATLADGWYAGYIGYALFVKLHSNPSGRGFYGETPSLSLQLEIEYADGTRKTIVTDGSWKTSLGPVTETDILMGEAYDARKELGAWTQTGYDDRSWEAATVVLPYVDILEPHPGVPVRITDELPTKRILEPEPGVYIFDLGQNFSGIPRIKVKGKRGTKVRIRTGEMIRPDNTLLTANLRCARSTNTYTLKGSKQPEIWAPQFVYHGFQYIELTGLDEKPDLDAVTGLVMHSDTPLTGSFECSDPMLNQLYSNIVWTQRANFLEVPTDCPQRDERLGWTGDAQIFVNAATYNADISAFYKKWLIDLKDSQWGFGAYPSFAPRPYHRPGFGHGTAWMDAGVICPWTIWQVYGDLEVVENNWQSMEIFMHFRLQRDRQMLGQDEGKTWGDWLNLDQPTPLPYIDLCYYAYSSSLMAEMAEALGKTDRAKYFQGLRTRIGNSFAKLYLEGNGKLKVNTQTAYALALFMDLIPDNQVKAAGEQLAELVYEKDGRMATGFLGTRHLLPALTKSGQHALAGKLMQSTEYPSWGYEVVNGATSIWERWNSYIKGQGASNESMNSFSHYAFGAVGEWMFQNLVGISTLEPGWKSFRIAPNPSGDLTWVKGSFDSPQGRISVSWEKKEDGEMGIAVTVPPNASAQLELPTNELTVSGKSASKGDGVELVSFSEGFGVYHILSGSYEFVVPTN